MFRWSRSSSGARSSPYRLRPRRPRKRRHRKVRGRQLQGRKLRCRRKRKRNCSARNSSTAGEQNRRTPNARKNPKTEGYLQAGGGCPSASPTSQLATDTGTFPKAKPTSVVEAHPGRCRPRARDQPDGGRPVLRRKNSEARKKFRDRVLSRAHLRRNPRPPGHLVGKHTRRSSGRSARERSTVCPRRDVYNLEPAEASPRSTAWRSNFRSRSAPVRSKNSSSIWKASKTPKCPQARAGIPEEEQYYAHTLIEGNVEWGKQAKGTDQGDYHDYFEIDVSPALPLISSRLSTSKARTATATSSRTPRAARVTTRRR